MANQTKLKSENLAPTGHKDTKITDASAAALQATRDILDAIHRHRGDEQPIFDIILQNAARLCDAPLAGLTLANDAGDRLMVKSVWGDLDQRLPAPEDGFAIDSDVFPARAFRAADVLHIGDIRTVPEYVEGDPRYVALVEQHGFNAYLCVPLMMNGAPIGCIDLFRTTPEPFADGEIALVQSFATQAVIAIENARQFREVQERLERERVSAAILETVSRSRDDDRPVFQIIVEQAARLTKADSTALVLGQVGDRTLTLGAHVGGPEEARQKFERGEVLFDPEHSLTAQTILSEKVVHVPDMKETSDYKSGGALTRGMVDGSGVRSALFAPLIASGRGIGALAVVRNEMRPFTDDEITLVESFAAQAVIAIENARQFREVRERLEREKATGEVLGVISTSRDDEIPVFRTILENASRICNAPIAFLSLANGERTEVTIPAHLGTRSEFGDILEDFLEPITRTELVAVRPVAEGVTVLEDDIKDDDAYRNGDPRRLQMVDVEGARSVLAVPLFRDGLPIGAIVLYRREVAPFSEDDLSLVQAFAALLEVLRDR